MADKTGLSTLHVGDLVSSMAEASIITFTAGADISKGDPVYLSGDNEVSPATDAQDCIGIAIHDADAGDPVSVCVRGVVKVRAGGAIARGKAVYGADASRRVLELSDQPVNEGGADTYTIYYNRKLGTALCSADAADDLILILVGK